MKQKVLVALMTMLITIGLAGCGGDASANQSSTTPETRPTESVVVESQPEESSEETKGTEKPSEESKETEEPSEGSEESSVVANDTETGNGETDNNPEAEGQESNEPTPEPEPIVTPTNSGIVVCVLRNAGLGADYAIFRIDPETGNSEELNCFSHRNSNSGYLEMPPVIYYQNCSTMLSQDATKLAMTYTDNSTKLHHAGWIDSKGTFFDVTEHLGMKAENEFVAQPHYYALGFTRDGEYFVFAEIAGNHSSLLRYESDFDKFYYVSLDDLSTVYEGNPLNEEARKGRDDIFYALTDWVSNDKYLVDLSDNCFVRSVDNPGSGDTALIPGETRKNWNAVVGPDGRIAFASSIKNTGEDSAIYVVNSDGSNPQRVFDCGTFTTANGKFPNGYIVIYVLRWE